MSVFLSIELPDNYDRLSVIEPYTVSGFDRMGRRVDLGSATIATAAIVQPSLYADRPLVAPDSGRILRLGGVRLDLCRWAEVWPTLPLGGSHARG